MPREIMSPLQACSVSACQSETPHRPADSNLVVAVWMGVS